ncbi:hypothetical protein MMSR116_18305 [Methylobacterium mesophilicum SR1.6/6]|uniref:Uncharacterized protein n=1 Tax=Methylobacterium mesophilicum SR1.6/6 TaxID=908290 RepID=A0A6B9FM52_9HYPH|nr:hypothetical protein [Methylobacterium mesophilicum]QGY03623.1 hypothetical protein MMSR116_18305 [Methylobacterium mesophilicum SR1.6/6]
MFKIKMQNQHIWAVVTLEGGYSVIVWMMDTEEDAIIEQALRLAEGADRMTRYSGDQTIHLSKSLTAPSSSEIKEYAENNEFTWGLDLQRATFKSRSCIRLTKSHVPAAVSNG